MGNSLQNRTVLFVVWVRHLCHHFRDALLGSLAQSKHSTRHPHHSPILHLFDIVWMLGQTDLFVRVGAKHGNRKMASV
jgi:hypothetical protein